MPKDKDKSKRDRGRPKFWTDDKMIEIFRLQYLGFYNTEIGIIIGEKYHEGPLSDIAVIRAIGRYGTEELKNKALKETNKYPYFKVELSEKKKKQIKDAYEICNGTDIVELLTHFNISKRILYEIVEPKQSKKRWTKTETEFLKTARDKGYSYKQISKVLERTPNALRLRMSRLTTASTN